MIKPRIALSLILAVLLSSVPATADSLQRLEATLFTREPYVQFLRQPAQDFTLKDASGRRVGLADFRGKVVVLWFAYTHCPDVCPLQSEKLAVVQTELNRIPAGKSVVFVTITADPLRDTPDTLRQYGQIHGLDAHNWTFLTSGKDEPNATRPLAERYGLEFTAQPDGMLMHAVVTHVIDKLGILRARFHSLKFDSENLVTYVRALAVE
jgi:protein SCO1/2